MDLLPADFVAATNPKTPFKGYFFTDITDWQKTRDGHGLCASPAEYGVTGQRTFIINHEGVIYSRDLGNAQPVTKWPNDLKAWRAE